jgi:hypothetical protein
MLGLGTIKKLMIATRNPTTTKILTALKKTELGEIDFSS